MASRGGSPGVHGRALQRGAVLSSPSVDRAVAVAELLLGGAPPALLGDHGRRRARRGDLPDQPGGGRAADRWLIRECRWRTPRRSCALSTLAAPSSRSASSLSRAP